MPANSPLDSQAAMLRTALGDALRPADGVLDMFAEDGVLEFPYAPPDRVTGKPALRAYFAEVEGLLSIAAMTHRSDDGGTFVIEFRCNGTATETGRRYRQRYMSVITPRHGRIVRYRDYWNPLVVLPAIGGVEA